MMQTSGGRSKPKELRMYWWMIPMTVTGFCMHRMFMPLPQRQGDYDFSTPIFALLRLLWIIPALIAWLVYAVFVLATST